MYFVRMAFDNFHRPDEEPLNPANWAIDPAPGTFELAVLNNVCVADAGSQGDGGDETYIGVSVPNNQYAMAVVGNFLLAGPNESSEIAVSIRSTISSSTSQGYSLNVSANLDGTADLLFGDISSDSFFADIILPVVNIGDTIAIGSVGPLISAVYNGVIVASVVDTHWSSGLTGLSIGFDTVQSDTSVFYFETGGISNPTAGTIYPGIYGGSSLATAFANPNNFDLMQVVNEGGRIVWNLTAAGYTFVNPVSPTPNTILGKFFGSSFAAAFNNPNSLDVLQIINEGGQIIFGVTGQGSAYYKV
jgi:hypothetical protein